MYIIKEKHCFSKIGSKVVTNMSVICLMRMVVLDGLTIFHKQSKKNNNILCEYKILKSIFTKLGKHFEFSNAKYVNPKYNYMFFIS